MSRPTSPAESNGGKLSHLFDVYLRLRPATTLTLTTAPFLSVTPGEPSVYCVPPTLPSQKKKRTKGVEKFRFTHIFDEQTSQRKVFEQTVLPLLSETVKGRDGLLATLGVTGSGKTHTVLGNREQKGITQLALDVLFRSVGSRLANVGDVELSSMGAGEGMVLDAASFLDKITITMDPHLKRASLTSMPKLPSVADISVPTDSRLHYAVLISMYELYNDRIFDLLDENIFTHPNARRKALTYKASETGRKKVVAGLRKVVVRSLQEALKILEHGQACRHASPTNSNLRSSRSHAFFAIEIKRIPPSGWSNARSATLHIVDLAGSERSKIANTANERLAEAGSINRSLMQLGQVLQLQVEKDNGKDVQVPYRQCKLTELLFTNTLGMTSGRTQRAVMIVTADPRGEINATMQILRYSALAREVSLPKGVRKASGGSETSGMTSYTEGTTCSSASGMDAGQADLVRQLLSQVATLTREKNEMEDRWRDAENRLLHLEEELRAEMSEQMEAAVAAVEASYRERMLEEEERRQQVTDRKLEILGKMVESGGPGGGMGGGYGPDEDYIYELENENKELRMEIGRLMRANERLKGDASPRRARGGKATVGKVLEELENLNING